MSKYIVRIFKEVSDMNNPTYAILTIATNDEPIESDVGGWFVLGKVGGKLTTYSLPKDTLITLTVEVE